MHVSIVPLIVDNVIHKIAVCAGAKVVTLKAFAPGFGTTVYNAERAIAKVNEVIDAAANGGSRVLVYNWRNWIRATRRTQNHVLWFSDRIFDPVDRVDESDFDALVAHVQGIVPMPWMSTYANAAISYDLLEKSPILINGYRSYSKWDYDTYSGRSRSYDRPLQNLEEGTDIGDPNHLERNRVLTVDWKAADLMIAAYLSGDRELVNRIADGDIYGEFVDEQHTRQEIKRLLLSALYKADDEALAALSVDLAKWSVNQIGLVKQDQQITSYFGRIYRADGDRSELSAFNAQIQGIIALAMMHIVPRIQSVFNASFMFETHDSVTLVMSSKSAFEVANNVCRIMYEPMPGVTINDIPIRMPVTFAIGPKYGVHTVTGSFNHGKIKVNKK